jgi:hypothetical protein
MIHYIDNLLCHPTEKDHSQLCETLLILQPPDRGSSESDRKKIKLLGDPLDDMKRYLGLEDIRGNSTKSRHEEKRKHRESEHNHTGKANNKSEKKRHKSKKRVQTKDSSTNSESDMSPEVSKLLT